MVEPDISVDRVHVLSVKANDAVDRGEVGLHIESVSSTFITVPSSLTAVLDKSHAGEERKEGSLNRCGKRLQYIKNQDLSHD
jgi:hypothetical protein